MKSTLIVLVVVPDDRGRYLVVQERDGSYYLPAGKVEPGENLVAAALRETAEEAGIAVGLKGLLGFDHDEHGSHRRLRFCFLGWQAIVGPPKQIADEHSRGARFATPEEIAQMRLRAPEVLRWIALAEEGAFLPTERYDWFGPPGGPNWSLEFKP